MLKVKDVIFRTNQSISELSPDCKETYLNYYKNCLSIDPVSWLNKNESSYDEILNILEKTKSILNILDIGAGCGSESITFASYKHCVRGIDISYNRLKTAKERSLLFDFSPPIFSCENVFDLNGRFDIIWMNHSFHHIEPRRLFCQHVANMLEPKGKLIIVEPNGLNPLVQIKLFRKRGFKTILNIDNEDGTKYIYGNERITNHLSLKKSMEKNGLQHISTRFCRIFPNNPRYDKAEEWFKKIWLPIFLYTHMVLVFEK